jgi:hypothetical protein
MSGGLGSTAESPSRTLSGLHGEMSAPSPDCTPGCSAAQIALGGNRADANTSS